MSFQLVSNGADPIEIFVSNRNRFTDQDALEFSFTMPTEVAYTSYTLTIDKHTIEHIFGVIQQNINDVLHYEFNGAAGTIQFQAGNYTLDDIIDVLQAALTSLDPGLELLFDSLQYKLLLVVPAGNTFSLIRTHYDPLLPANHMVPDATDRMLEVLGWSFYRSARLDLTAGASDYTYVPDNIVRVRATAWLHMNIDTHVRGTYSTDSVLNDRTIARIPLIEPFGSLIHYQNTDPAKFILENADGLLFTVYFTDEWGTRLRLGAKKNLVIGFQMRLEPIPMQ